MTPAPICHVFCRERNFTPHSGTAGQANFSISQMLAPHRDSSGASVEMLQNAPPLPRQNARGDMRSSPAVSKPSRLPVADLPPFTLAIAAIMPSGTDISRPWRDAPPIMSPWPRQPPGSARISDRQTATMPMLQAQFQAMMARHQLSGFPVCTKSDVSSACRHPL